MKLPIQGLSAATAAFVFAMGTATAQSVDVQCVKGNDERSIKVVSPGKVGVACDVEYRRSDAGLSTPYHANNSADFCGEKANEIVSTLITSGYTCGQTAAGLTAEVRAPELVTAPDPVQQEVEPTQTSAVLNQDGAVEEGLSSDVETAALEELEVPAAEPDVIEVSPVENQPADFGETMKIDGSELAGELEAIEDKAQTAPGLATTGPATLGPTELGVEALPKLEPVTVPLPAGRLVGAAPSEPSPAKVPAQRELAPAIQPTQVAAPAAPAQADLSTAELAPGPKATKGRKPSEVIVATLKAQVAAWNEGNLAAFMDIYWRDDDLKFISGTNITKGWSSTMKRYRESYESDTGYGQLALEKFDVQEMTNDVAVVTGRFNLVNGDVTSSGVFTLVMQRINGVWRIVHDHTAADPL